LPNQGSFSDRESKERQMPVKGTKLVALCDALFWLTSGTDEGRSWQTVQNIVSSGERNKRKRKEEAAGSMTASEREHNFLQRES
jgi:hypothetical protein